MTLSWHTVSHWVCPFPNKELCSLFQTFSTLKKKKKNPFIANTSPARQLYISPTNWNVFLYKQPAFVFIILSEKSDGHLAQSRSSLCSLCFHPFCLNYPLMTIMWCENVYVCPVHPVAWGMDHFPTLEYWVRVQLCPALPCYWSRALPIPAALFHLD